MSHRSGYRGVVFDLDGTLVDSYEALARAVNFARTETGYSPLDHQRIRSFVGDGLERLLERAFDDGEVPLDAKSLFENHYDSICCEESRMLEDVEETVASLYADGFSMAVCTNKPTFFSRKILDFLGIARFFEAIVGPDLAGARKPDPRHVRYAQEATGCSREETLFVGDMLIDIEAARNAGLDIAVIPTGSTEAVVLREAKADYFLERFSDLSAIVRTGGSAQ